MMDAPPPKVELREVIDVPPPQVFDAWTRPDRMAHWIAPGDAAVLDSSVDLRVGGRYRIRMRGEMNGNRYDVAVGGIYRDIVPNERLCFTWAYEDAEHHKSVGDSLVTVTLRAVPHGTEILLVHEKILTRERREGHLWGWTDCLKKLRVLLGQAGGGTAHG
jgi:uncharacterized protein YndB with AHSA1/START domain